MRPHTTSRARLGGRIVWVAHSFDAAMSSSDCLVNVMTRQKPMYRMLAQLSLQSRISPTLSNSFTGTNDIQERLAKQLPKSFVNQTCTAQRRARTRHAWSPCMVRFPTARHDLPLRYGTSPSKRLFLPQVTRAKRIACEACICALSLHAWSNSLCCPPLLSSRNTSPQHQRRIRHSSRRTHAGTASPPPIIMRAAAHASRRSTCLATIYSITKDAGIAQQADRGPQQLVVCTKNECTAERPPCILHHHMLETTVQPRMAYFTFRTCLRHRATRAS